MLEATSASAVSTTEAPSVPALPQSEAAISDHNTVAWCLEDKVLIDCLGFFKSHASHSRNVGGAAHRGTSRWGMGRHYHTNSWNWPKLSDLLSKHSLEGGSLQIFQSSKIVTESESVRVCQWKCYVDEASWHFLPALFPVFCFWRFWGDTWGSSGCPYECLSLNSNNFTKIYLVIEF